MIPDGRACTLTGWAVTSRSVHLNAGFRWLVWCADCYEAHGLVAEDGYETQAIAWAAALAAPRSPCVPAALVRAQFAVDARAAREPGQLELFAAGGRR